MNFDWEPSEQNLIDKIGHFADSFFNHHKTIATNFDAEGWQACAGQGVLQVALPIKHWNGWNKGLQTTVGVFETLGQHGVDASLLFSLGAHLFGFCIPVSKYASPEYQVKFGKQLATGQIIGALAVTEPQGGSNPRKITTYAKEIENGFCINGEKSLITNAKIADQFLVIAATKPDGGLFGLTAFLIAKGTPGLEIEPLEDCFGLRGAAMGRIKFKDCIVPKSSVIGSLNTGFHLFAKAMLWERTGLLSGLLGVAQRDIDNCVKFANERKDENGPLALHQALSHRIAKMQIRLATARLLVYNAAWAIDGGRKDSITKASMAKYQASEVLLKNAIDSMRIQAGSGWIDKTGPASQLRNAVGTLFASGTSEIQLNIIASSTGLKHR
jgi:alkylation response protein AidB-like acyl-CoA dehydrogenase